MVGWLVALFRFGLLRVGLWVVWGRVGVDWAVVGLFSVGLGWVAGCSTFGLPRGCFGLTTWACLFPGDSQNGVFFLVCLYTKPQKKQFSPHKRAHPPMSGESIRRHFCNHAAPAPKHFQKWRVKAMNRVWQYVVSCKQVAFRHHFI